MSKSGSMQINGHAIFDDKHKELFDKKRDRWSHKREFVFSCLGFTIGISTFLKFPILLQQNGGVTFLIPYVVMLLLVGLPIMFLNMSLGQYHSLAPNNLLQKLSSKASGIGYMMVIICFLVSVCHAVVLSWSMYYTYASFNPELPYGHCNHNYSSPACYTNEHLASCPDGRWYYNRKCLCIHCYCGKTGADFKAYNETHCVSNTDENDIRSADALSPGEAVARRIYATEDFQRQNMLGWEEGNWSEIGGMQWHLVICLLITWVCVSLGLFMGPKSMSKVMYLTVIFPYIAMICLFINAINLPGAYDGVHYFFAHMHMDRVFTVKAWFDAATHVFQTFGMSLGGFMVLASYNKFNNNSMVDALTVVVITAISSILFGIVLFSIIGFLAYKLDLQVWQLLEPDSIALFVVAPGSLALMPNAHNWAILFYIMIISLGINTQLVYVETVSATIKENFGFTPTRFPVAVSITCVLGLICGLPMCIRGGQLIYQAVTNYVGGMALVLCVLHLITSQYFYGFNKIMQDILKMGIEMPLFPPGLKYFWQATWCIITPVILIVVIVLKIMHELRDQLTFRVWPPSDMPMYWLVIVLVLVPVILKALFDRQRQANVGERVKDSPRMSVVSTQARRPSEIPTDDVTSEGRYLPDAEGGSSRRHSSTLSSNHARRESDLYQPGDGTSSEGRHAYDNKAFTETKEQDSPRSDIGVQLNAASISL